MRYMNIYTVKTVNEVLSGNPYPGRGIIIGKSLDGKSAVTAYFIMGRSQNSRNRIFIKKGGALFTHPYDETKVEDPSLIIYPAVKQYENELIVTNGDQTDTIYNALKSGKDFLEALQSRTFEPDAPNLTPRISGILSFSENDLSYRISILKSIDPEGSDCARYCFSYKSKSGLGHLIHTYETDGDPIPTFQGEPRRISIPNSIDEFANDIWHSLNSDNKISLYVRYTDLSTGEYSDRIINKNN